MHPFYAVLREVPFSKADKHEYFTVSRHGVTYWSDSENHFTALDAWLADYRKYRRLTELGFFKHYRLAKAFRLWLRNIQWYKYENARQKIAASAFVVLPRLARALLTMQDEYVQLVGFRFFDVSVSENWHLPYFIETQMTTFEQVRDLLQQLREKMRNVLCKRWAGEYCVRGSFANCIHYTKFYICFQMMHAATR